MKLGAETLTPNPTPIPIHHDDEHSRNRAGNVFNLQDFEQNKIKFKQRIFEDCIGTPFVLIDADLLLIWMNKFQLCFRFRRELCPVLLAVLIIS